MKTIRTAIIISALCLPCLSPAGWSLKEKHGMVVGSGGHQSGPSLALWSVRVGSVGEQQFNGHQADRGAGIEGGVEAGGTVQVISQNVDRVNDTDPMIAQVDESTAVVVWSSVVEEQ